jgi:hypothetical protein
MIDWKKIRRWEREDEIYWHSVNMKALVERLKAEPVPEVAPKKAIRKCHRPAWYDDFVIVGRPRGCDRLDLPMN